MNRNETHKLFGEGKTSWNTWAQRLLHERDVAEKEGTFNQDAWLNAAAAEFSTLAQPHTFNDSTFSEFIFPGPVEFSGAEFLGDARFGGVTFHHNVSYRGATFKETSSFKRVSFGGETRFNGSHFRKTVSFMGSTFTSDARFEYVVFYGNSWFGEVTFNGTARFTNSEFFEDMGFKQARFEWLTIFTDVIVHKAADFSAINSSRHTIYSNAQFRTEVPCFIQASFKEAPRLDNITIPPAYWGRSRSPPPTPKNVTDDQPLDLEELRDRPMNYRALRRLALQGLDYRLAQDCVAYEIRSSRRLKDIVFPRLWLGFAYEILSNFGRSLLLPLVWLVVFCFISAGAFLWLTPAVVTGRANAMKAETPPGILTNIELVADAMVHGQPCYSDEVASPADGSPTGKAVGFQLPRHMNDATIASQQAIVLAFRNALILQGSGEDAATRRALGCLYGFQRGNDAVGNLAPNVPISMTIVSGLQKLASGLLIFLFGLAARNILRMK